MKLALKVDKQFKTMSLTENTKGSPTKAPMYLLITLKQKVRANNRRLLLWAFIREGVSSVKV